MTVQLVNNSFFKHQKMSILDLPTEILSEIFKEVVTASFRSEDPKELREQFKTLCLVHSRFYVITQEITIPHRLGLHLSQDERRSVDSQENHSHAEISKDQPKQWRLLFECWETMKDIYPNMDKNTFQDQITVLKNNEVEAEADVPEGVFGATPLSLRSRVLSQAAFLGHRSVVHFVLNHNSNIPINIREESLRRAAWYGHLEVVKELLKDHGASVETKAQILRHAARRGDLEIVKEFLRLPEISAESKGESLQWAVEYCDRLEVIQELLRAPEISAEAKVAALKWAVERGRSAVIKEFLRAPGISAEAKSESLKWAAFWGKSEVVKELLKDHGILAEAKRTSFLVAAELGHFKVVKEVLKDYGRSAEAKGKSLVSAVRCGCLEVIKLTFRSWESRFFN